MSEDPLGCAVDLNGRNQEALCERYELAKRLQVWLKAAAPRFEQPSLPGCVVIATALLLIRERKQALRQRRSGPDTRPARRYGRLFLTHLKPVQTHALALVRWAESIAGDEVPAVWREAQEKVESAVRAVEALLPALSEAPLEPLPDADPIPIIAVKAQLAWASANNGKSPRSRGADAPLVKFLTRALASVGMNLSSHTISGRLPRKLL
jgi:hypothetical protein